MSEIRGWFALVVVLALAGAMAITAVTYASAPTLADRIARAVPDFASKKGEPVDARELAEAIVTEANGKPASAALLLTIAIHESGLRESVRLDQYTDKQADSYRDANGELKHRASGLWQVHSNAHNAAVWGSPSLKDQAHMAAMIAAGAFARCKKSTPFPLGVFRAYAGRQCDLPIKGEDERVRTYSSVLRRIQ